MKHNYLFLYAICFMLIIGCGWPMHSAKADESTLKSADQLFWKGRYAEAIEQYESVLEEEEQADFLEASLGLAQALKAIGKTEEAIALLEKHPKAAKPLAELARLFFEQGRYPEAEVNLKKALSFDAKNLLAQWIQAELFRVTGKLKEADEGYRKIVRHYNEAKKLDSPYDLQIIGLAAAQNARWNRISDQFSFIINDLHPEALALEPNFWPAHLESGKLFLEKFNDAEAKRSLTAARKMNPSSPDVLAALAELAIGNFELDEATLLIRRAKQVNPNHIQSLLMEADIAFMVFDQKKAIELLEKARGINSIHAPTLGRLAAAYGLADGGFAAGKSKRLAELIAEVETRNPHAGDFYYHLGLALDKSRKYPDAVAFFEKAMQVMPQMVGPRAQFGQVQMRLGEETIARKALDESFAIDPFNVRVKNTLAVLDVLKTYEDFETEHFIIRFDPKYDKVLAKCTGHYLESIYPELTEKLGYKLPQKTLIEIFNKAKNTDGHGWFSARMVGLPRIHTIGACAGKMVAITSPTSMGRGKFHWAQVMRHELVHVINLQQTNFNIPHWYTEGLAVLLENQPRQTAWEQLLATRVPKGEVFNLNTINLGFVRPRSGEDWQMAYCQAELYAIYMLERFGKDANSKLLNAYANNLPTPEAIEKSFGVTVEDFEKGYTKKLKEVVAKISQETKPARSFRELKSAHEKDPKNADAAAELAVVYLKRREYPTAKKMSDAVLKMHPKHQLANYIQAKLKLVVGETEKAKKMLLDVFDEQNPDLNVLKLLAALHTKEGDLEKADHLFEIGAKKQPNNLSWIKRRSAVAIKLGDKKRLKEFLEILAERETDNVLIRKKLARMAAEEKDFVSAAHWAEDAVFIDITDAGMHILRADSYTSSKEYEKAANAYELCVDLLPKKKSLRLAWAKSCKKAGQADRMKTVLKPLIEKGDPEAKKLLEE